MQIEPNENASKRTCTSRFSNRFVIAAAPHSGPRGNIGLQRVEASDLTTRFSVRGKYEIPMCTSDENHSPRRNDNRAPSGADNAPHENTFFTALNLFCRSLKFSAVFNFWYPIS